MFYPKELFCINETITRENIRRYEQRQRKIIDKCLELCPGYYQLDLRERRKIRDVAEMEVK